MVVLLLSPPLCHNGITLSVVVRQSDRSFRKCIVCHRTTIKPIISKWENFLLSVSCHKLCLKTSVSIMQDHSDKIWICLQIDHSKGVHVHICVALSEGSTLETVSDLTMDVFVASLRHFIARCVSLPASGVTM